MWRETYTELWLVAMLVACGSPRERPNPSSPSGEVHWPPIVDSHVHLALDPVADQLQLHGVLVAVDLAAPERAMADPVPIEILRSGPMLTRPNGYPLDEWGKDGYGIGCDDEACVRATVDRLVGEGARVIKIAGDDDGLAVALMPAAVQAAHAHHLKVAIHALSDSGALAGAKAGCDILAHTPLETLSEPTIAAWAGRTVISTLAAFGGTPIAVENLKRLHVAGVMVLYGTDLGNLKDTGPSHEEVSLLEKAGLSDAQIVAAMTTLPLAFWNVEVDPGTYLVLDGDPRTNIVRLLSPLHVFSHGKSVR
jgi:hypothetical protein